MKIRETCGLKAKFMAVTGDKDPKAAELVGGKVLRLCYKLAEDVIELKTPCSPRSRGGEARRR